MRVDLFGATWSLSIEVVTTIYDYDGVQEHFFLFKFVFLGGIHLRIHAVGTVGTKFSSPWCSPCC